MNSNTYYIFIFRMAEVTSVHHMIRDKISKNTILNTSLEKQLTSMCIPFLIVAVADFDR